MSQLGWSDAGRSSDSRRANASSSGSSGSFVFSTAFRRSRLYNPDNCATGPNTGNTFVTANSQPHSVRSSYEMLERRSLSATGSEPQSIEVRRSGSLSSTHSSQHTVVVRKSGKSSRNSHRDSAESRRSGDSLSSATYNRCGGTGSGYNMGNAELSRVGGSRGSREPSRSGSSTSGSIWVTTGSGSSSIGSPRGSIEPPGSGGSNSSHGAGRASGKKKDCGCGCTIL